ncbi:MAG: LPS-assembly protein LptD [Cyanobacteria bacterium SZAS-4]|nr:LPS-assembly protein LptD [Cyanobacteria bacterium SZAS-4]
MAFKPAYGVQKGIYLALSLVLALQTTCSYQALAQSAGPTGTMLLPMTPKLDVPKAAPLSPAPPVPAASPVAAKTPSAPNAVPVETGDITESDELLPTPGGDEKLAKEKPSVDKSAPTPAAPPMQASANSSSAPLDATADPMTDDVTLKGTVQIVADDTEYDQEKNTFLGTGNAVAIIAGQNSKLEADMILYDQNDQTMDARGNVRITRNGQLTTGSSFKFNVTSDEYLITKPDTEVQGSQVVARTAKGTKDGLTFLKGTMTPPKPFYMQRNAMWGPVSYRDDVAGKQQHPDAYLGGKQHFVFKANKMVYERYKEDGNLTMFGSRLQFNNFSIPMGKVVASVGGETRVTMPVTPYFGNNLQSGGINVGPKFNTGIGKDGVLSWAPLIQFGGKQVGQTAATDPNNGKIGLGGQVSFTNDKVSSHLAYGSVSNLLVGDLKFKVPYAGQNTRFQLGINRYLSDGMFGMRRARAIAEVYHNKTFNKVPFFQNVNFRTAAGVAQDNPQLINQSGTAYANLFGQAAQNKTVMTTAARVSEQLTATTHNLFVFGDDKYGVKSYIYGGVGVSGYSTGNARMMSQAGPVLDMHLNKLRLQTGYTQSAVKGSSPFVFDQFIQGSRSAYVSGDVKASKYVTLGGTLGWNFDAKMAYAKTVTAAIGPEDFKVILSRDMVRGTNRFGFDLLYGQPLRYNKLVLKGNPDQGQQGGIN